jgi:H+-transporting ATPase
VPGVVIGPNHAPRMAGLTNTPCLPVCYRRISSASSSRSRPRASPLACAGTAPTTPALRQAQIGIAVSTATEKSAAGIVLTGPGLAGIVAAVREGRVTFQRILTYTLRSLVNKVRQVLFPITGHAILTPLMMVLLMISGDFLAMSATTDNVVPLQKPNTWRIDSLTITGTVLGLVDLAFCIAVLAIGKYRLGLGVDALQTPTVVTFVLDGQAVFYVVRERRRMWSSRPGPIVLIASIADVLIIPTLASIGILMKPLPLSIIFAVFGSAIVLALVLDIIKVAVLRSLGMDE